MPALDLDAGDPGAFDRHDEVDLVVLLVVRHALADDDEIVRTELLVQRAPDLFLPIVGEPRVVGQR